MFKSELIKKLKKENGYTLIELLLTIMIVSLILMITTYVLIQLLRVGQVTDQRRTIRQDIELSMEVLRRDLRNADPGLSLTSCATQEDYNLVDLSGNQQPDTLDLVFNGGLETVSYSVVEDSNGTGSIVRTYSDGADTNKVYLSSQDVDIKFLEIKCSRLLRGNKFLLVEVQADSTMEGKNGKIVNDVVRYTGATIRNTIN